MAARSTSTTSRPRSLALLTLAGPAHSVALEAPYLAAGGWTPGRPYRQRILVIPVAVGFSLLCIAACLRPWRFALPLVLLISTGGVLLAAALLAPAPGDMHEATAAISADQGALEQLDLWHYRTPVRPGQGRFPLQAGVRPVLFDVAQVERAGLALVLDADAAYFRYRLPDRARMVFLQRQLLVPTQRPVSQTSARTDLIRMANTPLRRRRTTSARHQPPARRRRRTFWGLVRIGPADSRH